MKPGIYPGLSMAEYLAAAAVSNSIIQTLLDECPRAAWYDSWLNPKREQDTSDEAQTVGMCSHALLLEGNSDCVQVIDPRDHPNEKGGGHAAGWTNKSIKLARDAAIAAGKTPMLLKDYARAKAMADTARQFIESLRHAPAEDLARSVWAAFQPDGGDSEVTMVWDDDGVICRIRPDRISKDRTVIVDVKTVTRTAEPNAFGRTGLAGMGYYVGGSFYRRGVHKLCGVLSEYVFLVQEQEAPFLCSLVGIDGMAIELGNRRVTRGLATWRTCAKTDNWPAYPNRVVYPELPAWEFTREEASEVRAGIPYDPAVMFADLRRPQESDLIFPS